MHKTFTYKSKYGEYHNCYFDINRYIENSNLAISIWSAEEGPITTVTVNPSVGIPDDYIAVRNYSENEGMVEFLQSMDIIVKEPVRHVNSGYVMIPIYRLTENGRKIFGVKTF